MSAERCMCGGQIVMSVLFSGLKERILKKKTVSPSGCWLWPVTMLDTNGYGQMRVFGKLVRVSRLVYELYYGPIGNGLFVCHKCDTPSCINPEHLWLGTAMENMQDMIAKGRQKKCDKRGEKNSNARFTEADILTIRNSRLPAPVIARALDTTPKNIRRIRSGQRWPHLPFDPNYNTLDDR